MGLTAERLNTITDGLTCTVALGEQRWRSCSLWPMCVGALSRCQRKQRPRNRQHTCQLCFPWSWQRWRWSGFWVKYLHSPLRTCVDCMFNRLSHLPAVHHLYRADVRSHFTVMAWANSVVKQNKQQFVRQPKTKQKKKVWCLRLGNTSLCFFFFHFFSKLILKPTHFTVQDKKEAFKRESLIYSAFRYCLIWMRNLFEFAFQAFNSEVFAL